MFKEDVATTLCMLEMEMPPSFFDVMMHLVIHLVEELDLCGLVHTWWMYCIKHMNKVFKGYVQCMKWPEGCMARDYAMEESMGVFDGIHAKFHVGKSKNMECKRGRRC
jgi:hypothetical protein